MVLVPFSGFSWPFCESFLVPRPFRISSLFSLGYRNLCPFERKNLGENRISPVWRMVPIYPSKRYMAAPGQWFASMAVTTTERDFWMLSQILVGLFISMVRYVRNDDDQIALPHPWSEGNHSSVGPCFSQWYRSSHDSSFSTGRSNGLKRLPISGPILPWCMWVRK